MPASTLFDFGPEAYRREALGEAGRPWCFLHIPKTAGTSFVGEASAILRPAHAFISQFGYERIRAGTSTYQELLQESLRANADKIRRGLADFLTGHMEFASCHDLLGTVPGLRLMTFLRDPVDRVISDYRYCLTDAHPASAAFAARYRRITDFLESAGEMDKAYRYLCVHDGEPADEVIERLERGFAFVGLVERFEDFRRLFWALNGLPAPPARHANPTRNDKVTLADLSVYRTLVAEANPRDMAIHAHFARRAAPVLEAIRLMVAEAS